MILEMTIFFLLSLILLFSFTVMRNTSSWLMTGNSGTPASTVFGLGSEIRGLLGRLVLLQKYNSRNNKL